MNTLSTNPASGASHGTFGESRHRTLWCGGRVAPTLIPCSTFTFSSLLCTILNFGRTQGILNVFDYL